jgi:hypothetical protein
MRFGLLEETLCMNRRSGELQTKKLTVCMAMGNGPLQLMFTGCM